MTFRVGVQSVGLVGAADLYVGMSEELIRQYVGAHLPNLMLLEVFVPPFIYDDPGFDLFWESLCRVVG